MERFADVHVHRYLLFIGCLLSIFFVFKLPTARRRRTYYAYDVRQWMPSCLIVSYFCLLHVRGSAAQIFIFPGDENVMTAMDHGSAAQIFFRLLVPTSTLLFSSSIFMSATPGIFSNCFGGMIASSIIARQRVLHLVSPTTVSTAYLASTFVHMLDD